MRILSVSTLDHGGGAEKIARDLTQAYRMAGHMGYLAVGHRRGNEPQILHIPQDRSYQPKNLAAPVRESHAELMAKIAAGQEIFDFPGTWDFLDLPPERPDIVQCHNLHGNYFDLRALPWLSHALPTVLTLHDAWTLSGHCAHSFDCERWRTGCGSCPDLGIYPALRADGTAENWERKRTIYRQSRLHVATPCQWLMDKVQQGILAEGIVEARVIRHGVDLSAFRPRDKMEARRALGLPPDGVILMFVANGIRNNPWKDYAGIRQVLERLAERIPEKPLLLIGLGENSPPERIGKATINFVPFQHNPTLVATLYQAADIYLHMARAETYPNVIMEALCCGTAVAAAAVGGIAEQVRSFRPFPGGTAHPPERANGLLVAPGDIAGMVEGLTAMLSSPALLQKLGANAETDGRDRFDFRRTAREYLEWFSEILQRASASSAAKSAPTEKDLTMTWLETLANALSRGQPVSRVFGLDRGTPIDRYYIENFLAAQSATIRGRVLEIGDSTYTRRFGGNKVTKSDVLHAQPGNSAATIVGDLASEKDLPASAFDCVILTQTLQFLYNYRLSLANARRILAPGGVLLATFPNITPISRYDMDRWGDYWRLTSRAAERLFGEVFKGDKVEVFVFGNAASATAFLNGLAVQDLPRELLDVRDRDYEVLLAVKVTRAGAPGIQAAPTVISKTAADGSDTPSVVLMYHRVADLKGDPQLLSVRPARFAEHLDVLRRIGTPMALSAFAEAVENGETPKGKVIVTFDDGYADNLHNAKPLLVAQDIPATVFVTSGALGTQSEFWWDELERLILTPGQLPPSAKIQVKGKLQQFDLGESATYSEADAARHAAWSVLRSDDPTPRHTLYRTLQSILYAAGESDTRRPILDAIARWAGATAQGREDYRALTPNELIQLADGNIVEIGAHTVTHPLLACLPPDRQRAEILDSRKRLQELTGKAIDLFAYPYGSVGAFNQHSISVLRDAGFLAACTTVQSPVWPPVDLLQIPRMVVRNWSGDVFEKAVTEFRRQAARAG